MLLLFLVYLSFSLIFVLVLFISSVKWQIHRYNYWLERQAEIMVDLSFLTDCSEGDEWRTNNASETVDDVKVEILLNGYKRAREAVYDFEDKLSVRLYLKYLQRKK